MTTADSGPLAFFSAGHAACDELWGQIEQAGSAGDAARTRELWERFDAEVRRHLDQEEQVLFPALEEATGMHGMGPTMVMRAEHTQMRAVLDQMAAEAQAGNVEELLDHGDTLLMLTQQHNAKEEGILYPMAQDALGARWPELAAQLERY